MTPLGSKPAVPRGGTLPGGQQEAQGPRGTLTLARPWGTQQVTPGWAGGLLPPRGEGERASPLFVARKGVRRGPLGCWQEEVQGCLLVTELGEPELASEQRQPHQPWKHPQKAWDFGRLCLGHCSFLIRSLITREFNSKQCYQHIQMIYILSHLLSLSHTLLSSKRWICKAFCDEK